jgi:chemotaxis protein methyltransferase CheR
MADLTRRLVSCSEIEDVEVSLVLTALERRWGYDFTGYALSGVKRRLARLCEAHGAARALDLLAPILSDERIAWSIIHGMSVPTSEFFRDPEVWRYLREAIVLQLESFPRVNIWQIGCGRGEETYSLSILLHELGLSARTRLIVTDFNADLLAAARAGAWGKCELDHWTRNYAASGGVREFENYFNARGDQIVIADGLRCSIEFVQHNLVTDDVFLEAQLIVCRNVLIYFGLELQERSLDIFRRSLQRGGYLLLGRSEAIFDAAGTLEDFDVVQDCYRIYRKPVRMRSRVSV